MNSSAEDLMDFKSAKSKLRKIASFPVCSFSSVMADFAFSSLRTAMYTFALWASNAYMFCDVRVMELFALTKICLCSFFSNPYLSSLNQYYCTTENMILQHTCIRTSDDDDLSGQIRDVL